MRVIVAPQAFKGTASASEVAYAMSRGIKSVLPNADIVSVPIADGGTGTVEALVEATAGNYFDTPSKDPLGRPISAHWGVLGDGYTAIIEVASASGLGLLAPWELKPTITTSRGTGILIRTALDSGCSRVLIGLGDSATNDAGIGLAQELGVRALDQHGDDLPSGGASLINLHSLSLENIHPRLKTSKIEVLCDVTVPLCGPNGASYTFGPQKGASQEQIDLLDSALSHFADVVELQLGIDIRDVPGSGAAGGLGGGLMAFFGAKLSPGFDFVKVASGLEQSMTTADIVITGEGRIDSQTLKGKGVSGIAKLANNLRVHLVLAVTGQNNLTIDETTSVGLNRVYTLRTFPETLIKQGMGTLESIEATTARGLMDILEGAG